MYDVSVGCKGKLILCQLANWVQGCYRLSQLQRNGGRKKSGLLDVLFVFNSNRITIPVGASDPGNTGVTVQVDIQLKLPDVVKTFQVILARFVVGTGILVLHATVSCKLFIHIVSIANCWNIGKKTLVNPFNLFQFSIDFAMLCLFDELLIPEVESYME